MTWSRPPARACRGDGGWPCRRPRPADQGTSRSQPRRRPTRPGRRPTDALARARTLYNDGRYEAAIAAPTKRNRAITTRCADAHYRPRRPGALSLHGRPRRPDAGARRAAPVDPAALDAAGPDRSADRHGRGALLRRTLPAAADLFESMLNSGPRWPRRRAIRCSTGGRRPIDRHVRMLPPADRAAAYDHLIAHMESELRRDSGRRRRRTGSPRPLLPAARSSARGTRRFRGWVRALLTADRGAALQPGSRSAGQGSDHPRARPPAADRRHARS